MDDRKPMDLNTAVFNGHVNRADKRARALMAEVAPNYLKELEEIETKAKGIMGIFHHPMTFATLMYSAIVCAYVNEEHSAPERIFSLEEMVEALASDPQLREKIATHMREKSNGPH